MNRIERLSEEWLRANDWDYQKYADRRQDRSAYDTMMNYEISGVLEDAFQAGFRACRDLAYAQALAEHMGRVPAAANSLHERIRQLGEDEVPEHNPGDAFIKPALDAIAAKLRKDGLMDDDDGA